VQAQGLIANVVRDLTGIVNSGRSVAGMIGDFEGVLQRYGDMNVMARSALGAPARTASESDIAAFTTAFRGYLARKYGGLLFTDYNSGNVEVTNTRPVQSFFVVESRATLRRRNGGSQEVLRVDWHVSDRSGRDLFFNMVIEGINLLTNERQEIGALLDQRRGDIARLTRDLATMG
jgi:phospholipid transport system substrate-binding protein